MRDAQCVTFRDNDTINCSPMSNKGAQPLAEMKPAYEHIALLTARGLTNPQIAEVTGYTSQYVWRLKNEVEGFDALVAEFKREIHDRVIEKTVDLHAMFNAKAPQMVDNLEKLALEASKEGVRLRATTDWLDRAPDAPKRVHRAEITEDRKIVFSVQAMDNIKGALADVGADDVIDLLEGDDYEAIEAPPDGSAVNADEL